MIWTPILDRFAAGRLRFEQQQKDLYGCDYQDGVCKVHDEAREVASRRIGSGFDWERQKRIARTKAKNAASRK